MHSETVSEKDHRITIVGGGFGGLATARALRSARAHVLLIDKSNHHLLQPLLRKPFVLAQILGHGRARLRYIRFQPNDSNA
jgi:NADH dehydrogenase FAD-containing subunit